MRNLGLIIVLLLCGGCVVYFGKGEIRKGWLINEPCFGCCEKAINDFEDPIRKLMECSDLENCRCH